MGRIFNPISIYYISHWFYKHHIPILPILLQKILFFVFHAVVPYTVEIGTGCTLGHGGVGVVIHPQVRIGRNVLIANQVTLGGSGRASRVPEIGDDVYIGSGAKILGPVTIGSNCIVGANAVVVKSIPSGCVAAGVPARILKQNIDAHSIEQW